MKKSAVFWTRYDRLGASSRLRFFQFVPLLQEYNWLVECRSFFPDEYLQQLYSGKGKSLTVLWQSWRRRMKQMRACAPDTPAVIEYELLPYLPYAMEKGFLKRRKYILNFDDAVMLRYEKIPLLRGKFERLASGAAGVIAANKNLCDCFSKYNSNILYLPTVPPELPDAAGSKAERFTLVWSGTPVTAVFLTDIAPALRQAAQCVDFQLLIVGGNVDIPGVDCVQIPWSEAAETAALRRAHVGIMPLPDTPFARGKSAYKLIRYQQAGLPAIASPVGENCRVLTPEAGFLADSCNKWVDAIVQLSDPHRREEMMPAIRKSAAKYEFAAAGKMLAEFMDNVL